MSDELLETIVDGLEPIALIIRADFDADGIAFLHARQFFPAGRLHAAPER